MKTQIKNSQKEIGSDYTEIKMEKINPYDMTDKEIKFCDNAVVKLMQEDRALYEKSLEVISRLKLAGLWRGHGACQLIVANAIKEEN
jgi:hypothetical protein